MVAVTKRPRRRMTSVVVRGDGQVSRLTHSFKLVGSGIHTGRGVGVPVRSSPFTVGGHRWCIKYYPAGYADDCEGYVSVFLHLLSKNTDAMVLHNFRLVNHATGVSKCFFSCFTVFNYVRRPSWGYRKFIKKTELEAQGYLKDDYLEIECDLTVIKMGEIQAPPPPADLQESDEEGASLQDDVEVVVDSQG